MAKGQVVNGYVIGRFGMGGTRIVRRAREDEKEGDIVQYE